MYPLVNKVVVVLKVINRNVQPSRLALVKILPAIFKPLKSAILPRSDLYFGMRKILKSE